MIHLLFHEPGFVHADTMNIAFTPISLQDDVASFISGQDSKGQDPSFRSVISLVAMLIQRTSNSKRNLFHTCHGAFDKVFPCSNDVIANCHTRNSAATGRYTISAVESFISEARFQLFLLKMLLLILIAFKIHIHHDVCSC